MIWLKKSKTYTVTEYAEQIEWEELCLNIADLIVFWVPRDLSLDSNGQLRMPAFTTNVEWGVWCQSEKVLLGFPEKAEKNKYLEFYAKKYNIENYNNLIDLLKSSVELVNSWAVEREKGDRFIPAKIWNSKIFQTWYQSQKIKGNRIESARVLWTSGTKEQVTACILRINLMSGNEVKTETLLLDRAGSCHICE